MTDTLSPTLYPECRDTTTYYDYGNDYDYDYGDGRRDTQGKRGFGAKSPLRLMRHPSQTGACCHD